MLHRQQVVAGRDARAALVHRLGQRYAAEQRQELGAQRVGALEASVGAEVVLEEAVQRTGDVAGGGVRLLDLPADVPADVAATVEQARQDIVSGKIKVSAIGDAEAMRARLDELNQ